MGRGFEFLQARHFPPLSRVCSLGLVSVCTVYVLWTRDSVQFDMTNSEGWLMEEMLQFLYTTVDDFRSGAIDRATFEERLVKLAEKYERNFLRKDPAKSQKDLF